MKNWTSAEIYVERLSSLPERIDESLLKACPLVFTPRFREAFRGETEWIADAVLQEPGKMDGATSRQVAMGDTPCPRCERTTAAGSLPRNFTGQTSGIKLVRKTTCPCSALRIMWRNVSVLPVNMRWSRLRDLQPYQQSPCPVDEQQKALDVMKANRHRSYLIVGPSSAGKTHLAAAIYSERVVEWVRSGFGGSCPATFIDTNTMLSQWMERNSNENAPAPTVTPGRVASIVARKLQPVLVLDDLDKIVVTAPRMAKLAEIVKFYDDADSQIVATSCLSPYDLANRWAEHGGDSTLNKILKRGTWVPLSAAE